ncbi:MAG: polysaccharide lyase family protein [Acidobacteria bacterium]|nr:polysaccharide lyase family protein [Acidobacteriota bacterium]
MDQEQVSRRQFIRRSITSSLATGLGWKLNPAEDRDSTDASDPKGTETLWQIGTFNYSSIELNQGSEGPPLFGQRFPKGQLVYVIGKSNPQKDWPAFQPGSANGRAGFVPHPYTIQFDLAEVPKGLVTLKIALLVENPRAPRLEVEINGHRARYYQRPKLNYVGGDGPMVVSPIASADTIIAEIPSAFLAKGANTLVLTAIDEPGNRDDVTGSGITYDAIELAWNADATFDKKKVTVEVNPTIFYQQKGDTLTELVDIYVTSNRSLENGRVTLKLGRQEFTRELSSKREFGEELVEFAVPEFSPGTNAEVITKIDGATQHFPVTISPAKQWTLYVVPNEHLDIGYTDYQAKVAEVQSRVLDEAIEMIHGQPDFRFSPDGFWCFEQFLAGRRPAERERLVQLVKEKKIFAPPQEASLLTGFASLEVLIRSLYSGFQFNQKYGGDFDYANITDVPSYSWSYASILAGAGLKYFIAASDNDNGPILLYSRLNEKSPFWWEGPDGARILMWYSRTYLQVAYLFGLPPFLEAGRDSVPTFLQAYSHPGYKSDAVIIYGTQVENTDLFPQQADLVSDWNKLYAYPKMQFSGFAEAMDHIVQQFGDSIPVVRGDGGPYWEFGNASDAAHVAMERVTEQRALSAEKFSTISTLVNPLIQPEREVLARVWRDMVLLDEHTWTYHASVSDPLSSESRSQTAVKENFAKEAKMGVDYLLRRHMAAIATSINNPARTLIVFNSLNWKRGGLVHFDLPKDYTLQDLVTKQEVPYETCFTGQRYKGIRFLAEDVPPVGYRCYALIPAKRQSPASSNISGEVLENDYYRVSLDAESGAVKSIFDKELNRELVNTASPYRFDQYLYVTGGNKWPNRVQHFGATIPIPKLEAHAAAGGRLVSLTKEPFGTVARLESSAFNTPQVSTEIILFDKQKKIGFINRIQKKKVYTKEGVYFAFPFMMDHPQFRYDIQNGFVDPARDQMPGAGKEWFSVQHWVQAQQDGVSVAIVPVDAHLVTLGDIVRGDWPKVFTERKGTIFSYVMNNYYFTNWPAAQGGNFTFRYVLTSARNQTPEFLSQFGRAEITPLELDEIISNDKAIPRPAPLPADQASFIAIDQPTVVLVTWKLAEDGDGMILRFLEVAGKSATVNVQIPLLRAEAAWNCNAMEQKGESLATSEHGFSFAVKPFQIITVRVTGTSVL